MNKLFATFFIFFLFSCNNEEKKLEQQLSTPKIVEAKSYVVPKDSIAESIVIPIDDSKLKKVLVGQLKVSSTNLNVHPAGNPKVIPSGNPQIITSGIHTFSFPKVVPVIDSPFVAKHPKSKLALPFRMKDNATCDIQYLDVDQGMNSSYVWSILEDKTGNLWFGTGGGGVSKYDGKTFTNYSVKEGLSSNYIRSILEDKSGNLWFGTDGGGVTKYDGKYFTHYTEKEGLSNDTVRSMLEDKSGNLWFCTNGGGVSKYDGKTFTHYTEKEGLSSNYVRCILEDRTGNLWFGTNSGGVSKYNGKTFTHYTEKEGLSNNTVRSMLEDKSGNLWFGTYGGGVCKYDGNRVDEIEAKLKRGESISDRDQQDLQKENGKFVKSFTHYTDKEGLSNNIVLSILEDKSGNLWFVTNGGGVSKYDGNCIDDIINRTNFYQHNQQDLKKNKKEHIKTFTHYTEKEGLSSNYVRSVLEDKTGNLWFGTDGGGVSKYDGKSFTYYTEKEGLLNNYVWSILEDKSGNLWFGADGGGVSKYDGKTFTHFSEKDGLSNNYVRCILEDKSGNLWFGTYGGGVSKYDGKLFTHYTKKEGLSNNYVWSILEDKSGNLWFGTDGGGVSKYDGNRVEEIEAKLKRGESISDQDQKDLKKENGKFVKSFTHYTKKEGLSNNYVWSILEDKTGNLWFGTNGGGVSKFNGKTFTHYTDKEGLSNNTVLSIIEDKIGNLWFGTNGGGLCKYDGNRVEEIEAKLKRGESISNRDQQDLQIENGKLIKSFTHYTDKEGLSNNTVWSILEDKNGNLWLSTEKGLNCFLMGTSALTAIKPQNDGDNFNPQIIVFHKDDGLIAEDFFQNSVLLDSKNRVWWGSGKALTMIDLNESHLNEKEPEIQLENIYLQENFVDYRSIKAKIKHSSITNENEELKKIKFTGVADFYNYPKDLELPYYLNHLTFYFSAIDWYAPHKIKYQYKLEGLDPDWSNLTSDNKADYRNIPDGKYTFKVKAMGSAGKWSKTFEYSFTIHPPWWRTWWAYTIYAFIGVTTIILIVWWNGRRLRARAEDLKIKVEEATIEIKVQKHLIEEKHKEITDSINYAERIQRALLASKKLLDENLASTSSTNRDYFILFKPKDIVSGDFYWATKLSNNNFVLVTADSTGHGVPGAIMSIVNIASLKEASLKGITSPDLLLNETRRLVIENLKNDGSKEGGKDGMDGSLLSFDFKNNLLSCASANNPIWIIRKSSDSVTKELIEIKADRFPIGKHEKDKELFTLHTLNLQKGDVVYTLTDGFPDQFGGQNGKKFKYKPLQELLMQIADEPMLNQKQKLIDVFEEWKGDLEQVDDVCIVGVRI